MANTNGISGASSNNKPVWILFGEGNFDFITKYIKDLESEDQLADFMGKYEIIPTEYRGEDGFGDETITMTANRVYLAERGITAHFKVDVCNLETFQPLIDNKEIEIVQFNCPWYEGTGNTEAVINGLYVFANNRLKDGGKLRVSLNVEEQWYRRYFSQNLIDQIDRRCLDDECNKFSEILLLHDRMYPNLQRIEPQRLMIDEYPFYEHRTSMNGILPGWRENTFYFEYRKK